MNKEIRHKISLIIFMCLFVGIMAGLISINNKVVQYPILDGIMNLEGENIEERVVKLQGNWTFYAGTFDDTGNSAANYLEVPGTWRNTIIDGKKTDKYDIGLYKLSVIVPEPGDYCIKLNYISSAYELYINDRLITSNGKIGTTKQEEKSSWDPKFVYFHTNTAELDIRIKVSNFHCNNGGIMLPIYFGRQEPMYQYQMLNIMKNIIFIGIFIGMAFYLSVFNWQINKKAQSVYLSIFCVATLVAASIIDGESLLSIFPSLSINLVLKIEYIAYMAQITAILFFLWSIYSDIGKTHPVHYIKNMDFIYTVILLCLPVMPALYDNRVFVPIIFINAVFYMDLILRAFRKKKPNAAVFLLGFGVFLLTAILQLLDIKQNINIKSLINFDFYSFGLLFFLLCQSYALMADIEDNFQKSKLAHEMEVASLQAQIVPHFLFNILNNIYYLTDTDVKMAKKLLICLSDFLRVKYKFDYRNHVLYTIGEELDLVRAYVELENVRLNQMLELVIDASDELLKYKIPPIILQPLVENSIKHGYQSGHLKITIRIYLKEEMIFISVEDNGAGMGTEIIRTFDKHEAGTRGIGINNINYRLQMYFNSKLEIESQLYHGTKISFQIPMRN